MRPNPLGIQIERFARKICKLPSGVAAGIPFLPLVLAILFTVLFVPNGYSFLMWPPFLILSVGFFTSLVLLAAVLVANRIIGFQRLVMRKGLSIDRIRSLHWHDFEEFIALLYAYHGYKPEMISRFGHADGGIDIILYRKGKKYLVQCKHHSREAIGVKAVRELYGLMERHKAAGAFFVTSGIFSDPVLEEFTDDPKLTLVDQSKILEMLDEIRENLPDDDKDYFDRLLEITQKSVAAVQKSDRHLSIKVPRCTQCMQPMVLRHKNNDPHERFWGCSNYLKGCRVILKIEEKDREFLLPGKN